MDNVVISNFLKRKVKVTFVALNFLIITNSSNYAWSSVMLVEPWGDACETLE